MVGWKDARRHRFFESFAADDRISVYSDDDNDVLVARSVVNCRPGVDQNDAVAQLRDFEPEIEDNLPIPGVPDPRHVRRLRLRGGTQDKPALEAVRTHGELITPSYVLLAQQRVQPSDDPEHSWPIPAPRAESNLGAGVRIAVVDTGAVNQQGTLDVWRGQPDLGPDPWENIIDPGTTGRLAWAAGHGTFIASLIGQVAPAATIIPIKACDPMGHEDECAVARGVDRAVASGAHIISLSWASYPYPGEASVGYEPVRLRAAVDRAVAAGVLVVAAAGNSASPDRMFPAAWADVVGVAALDRDGNRWDDSNYGEWVDASAVGHRLRGRYVQGVENPLNDPDGHVEVWDEEVNYATWSGTSFATPLVAAQIAVVKSVLGGETLSPSGAWERLRDMSSPAADFGCGHRIMVNLPGQL